MTIELDLLRRMKKMRLCLAFCTVAASLSPPAAEPTPQARELSILMSIYAERGPLIGDKAFERLTELLKTETREKTTEPASSAICGHGGSVPTSASGGSACPCSNRRKKDLGHLLAIDHLSYYM